MKTLKQLLSDLINSQDITGTFDAEGVLIDVCTSKHAEREIACWYLADGELLAEATILHDAELANTLREDGPAAFGNVIAILCDKEALKWAKTNEWDYVESELTQDFNARPEIDDTPTTITFREDVFGALDPTR